MAEAADKIAIKCKCGGRFRVPATARGKRIKCPKCANPLAIPAAAPAAPPPPPQDLGLLDALAGHEAASSAAAPAMSAACPNCTAPVQPSAVLCVGCGYNLQTGQLMGAVAPAALPYGTPQTTKSVGKASSGAAAAAAKGAGRLAISIALCAAGAFVGGLIWYGIAIATNYEIGLIASVAGILSGIGMKMGMQRDSAIGGVVAVVFTIAAIIGAKYMISHSFFTTLMPNLVASEEQMYASALTYALTDESFESQDVSPENARVTPVGEDPKTYVDPFDEATIDQMNDQQYEEYLSTETVYDAKYNEIEEKVAAMDPQEIRSQVNQRPKAFEHINEIKEMRDSLVSYSFKSSFGIFDAIWFLLAASAAWSIAGGNDD